jgi:predicted ABC-type transport system involved in lysophospholipase L1 biosynthesis ATPase subunit
LISKKRRENEVATLIATKPEVIRTPGRDALVAEAVTKIFKSSREGVRRAVDDVSLRVVRGEIYGLLGANGSGKSTLIRMFSTLLTPDAGEVRVFGLDIRRDEAAVKRLINRVSVEASFFKKLSAMENLIYAGRLYGIGPDESRSKAMAILRRLGVDLERVNEPLEKLSRGMQQKVAIARAFLTARCRRSCAIYGTSMTPPSCSRRMTSTRPSVSPTASGSCTTDVSWPKARPTSSARGMARPRSRMSSCR